MARRNKKKKRKLRRKRKLFNPVAYAMRLRAARQGRHTDEKKAADKKACRRNVEEGDP
jgi:hypothetical protein